MPSQRECLQGAFQAILRGDYEERDRLCALATTLHKKDARERALGMLKTIDFFVKMDGTVMASRDVMRAAL